MKVPRSISLLILRSATGRETFPYTKTFDTSLFSNTLYKHRGFPLFLSYFDSCCVSSAVRGSCLTLSFCTLFVPLETPPLETSCCQSPSARCLGTLTLTLWRSLFFNLLPEISGYLKSLPCSFFYTTSFSSQASQLQCSFSTRHPSLYTAALRVLLLIQRLYPQSQDGTVPRNPLESETRLFGPHSTGRSSRDRHRI